MENKQILNHYTNEVIFEGLYASMKDCIEDACKKGVSLAEASLKNLNLQSIEIENVNFHHAYLENVDFKNAKIGNINLQYAKLINVDFENATLKKLTQKASYLRDVNFHYTTQIEKWVCLESSSVYEKDMDMSTCKLEIIKEFLLSLNGDLDIEVVDFFSTPSHPYDCTQEIHISGRGANLIIKQNCHDLFGCHTAERRDTYLLCYVSAHCGEDGKQQEIRNNFEENIALFLNENKKYLVSMVERT